MEDKVIYIQKFWRSYKICKVPKLLVKNIRNISNSMDPISNYKLIDSSLRLCVNVDDIYLITRKNKKYLYELSSLKLLIDNKENEIFSNTEFNNNEVNEIKFYSKDFEVEEMNEKELLFSLKTKIFEIFNNLDTYFTLTLYESVDKIKLSNIFNELKLMWDAFKEDNNISDMELFGKNLITFYQKEEDLLNNINILINNNLEKPFRKNICYIIIGAFSYVDKNIKKIYKNIDFI